MSRSAETVYFNAVPLLVLAASYLLVTAQLIPTLWRERRRATTADIALLLILPCIATPALVFGIVVGVDGRPIGNHLWIAFAAILVALVPALIFLARWRERAPAFTGGMRAREAEERVSARDAELEAVGRISKCARPGRGRRRGGPRAARGGVGGPAASSSRASR